MKFRSLFHYLGPLGLFGALFPRDALPFIPLMAFMFKIPHHRFQFLKGNAQQLFKMCCSPLENISIMQLFEKIENKSRKTTFFILEVEVTALAAGTGAPDDSMF